MNLLSSLHLPLLPSTSITSLHPSINTPIFFPPPLRTTTTPNFTLKCRRSDYFEPQRFNPKPPSEEPSLGAFPPRVFVGYSIYKGKAALTIEPKAPEFTSLDSGSYKVSREGIVLLQFAPAVGTRQYDWGRKQVFSLSVVEIGTLMGLGPRDSCEFFHDPNKGKRSWPLLGYFTCRFICFFWELLCGCYFASMMDIHETYLIHEGNKAYIAIEDVCMA